MPGAPGRGGLGQARSLDPPGLLQAPPPPPEGASYLGPPVMALSSRGRPADRPRYARGARAAQPVLLSPESQTKSLCPREANPSLCVLMAAASSPDAPAQGQGTVGAPALRVAQSVAPVSSTMKDTLPHCLKASGTGGFPHSHSECPGTSRRQPPWLSPPIFTLCNLPPQPSRVTLPLTLGPFYPSVLPAQDRGHQN